MDGSGASPRHSAPPALPRPPTSRTRFPGTARLREDGVRGRQFYEHWCDGGRLVKGRGPTEAPLCPAQSGRRRRQVGRCLQFLRAQHTAPPLQAQKAAAAAVLSPRAAGWARKCGGRRTRTACQAAKAAAASRAPSWRGCCRWCFKVTTNGAGHQAAPSAAPSRNDAALLRALSLFGGPSKLRTTRSEQRCPSSRSRAARAAFS